MSEKPILFNTEMVRAILEGRKTQTRRVIKPQPKEGFTAVCDPYNGFYEYRYGAGAYWKPGLCAVDDVLWVRETWSPMYADMKSEDEVGYLYRADDGQNLEFYDRRFPGGQEWTWDGRWRPSIHMPKKAARIFLRVTDVRCERLHDMKAQDSLDEGVKLHLGSIMEGADPLIPFANVWDSTIKKADLPLYGWDANPWVWVISFERIQ